MLNKGLITTIAEVDEGNDNFTITNMIDYFHQKEASSIVIDEAKRELYEDWKSGNVLSPPEDEDEDFVFNHLTTQGHLLLSDDEPEVSVPVHSEVVSKKKFCKQYNLYLSKREQECISIENRKFNVVPNKEKKVVSKKEDFNEYGWAVYYPDVGSEAFEFEGVFLRPFKDYWIYSCKFSRMAPKDFKRVKKDLPNNFSWLIEECASMVEMHPLDLFEELWVVENYFAHILEDTDGKKSKSGLKTTARKNIVMRW